MLFDVLFVDMPAALEELNVGRNSGTRTGFATSIPEDSEEEVGIIDLNVEKRWHWQHPSLPLPQLARLELLLLYPPNEGCGLVIAVYKGQSLVVIVEFEAAKPEFFV